LIFDTIEAAQKAVLHNEEEVLGRNMKVEFAIPKENMMSSPQPNARDRFGKKF
jgi:hypothetical protein